MTASTRNGPGTLGRAVFPSPQSCDRAARGAQGRAVVPGLAAGGPPRAASRAPGTPPARRARRRSPGPLQQVHSPAARRPARRGSCRPASVRARRDVRPGVPAANVLRPGQLSRSLERADSRRAVSDVAVDCQVPTWCAGTQTGPLLSVVLLAPDHVGGMTSRRSLTSSTVRS